MLSIFKYYSFFLVVLAIAAISCQSQNDIDRTVIQNVTGYTFYEDTLREFSAIAFEEGKVVDVYTDTSFDENGDIEIIEGKGQVMLPGLIDAHAHVMGLGFQQIHVNLAGAASLEEALRQVEEYASDYPDLNWIEGRGWNHTHWDINRFPTAGELDKVVNERPVWLTRVDGHAGWANSKAMELAGITAETEVPQGGEIIRDENGEPTGIFVDAAMDLIASEIPEPTTRERKLAFNNALQQMCSHGLTSVHDAGVGIKDWQLYKSVADSGHLTTRIYAMISGTGATFDTLAQQGPIPSYKQDMLALRSVKIYADGALGSRGAAMIDPYSDDPDNRGLLFASEEEMTNKVLKTASAGYQTNVHAIGDRANRVVLNAFESVKDSLGNQGLRHRIEHAQIVAPGDFKRFGKYNVIPSIQPTHATSDMFWADERLGEERLQYAYAYRQLLEQAGLVANGSDFPVEPINPLYGFHAAVARQNRQNEPAEGFQTENALTRQQALKGMTRWAAYANLEEDQKGSIEPGKVADFVVLERDIMEIPIEKTHQVAVSRTFIDGQQVYPVPTSDE
jgi:predicted amidohydrolase YtcJ